jgi:mRNA export factor
VFSAGADKMAKMLDTQNPNNGAQQVAAHDNVIRCIETFQQGGMNFLVTGSWDKTIKYWNLQQQTPVATVQVSERVYTMDIQQQLLVVGTADRWLEVFNLANPQTVYKKLQSPLKWQTRVVTCFPDATGYAIGSIEGRCAIQYVEEKDSQ